MKLMAVAASAPASTAAQDRTDCEAATSLVCRTSTFSPTIAVSAMALPHCGWIFVQESTRLRRTSNEPMQSKFRRPFRPERRTAASARHGLFHRRHQLFQREWLRQESELSVLGQMLFEYVLGIAGNENDLQFRIAFSHFL